MSSLLFFQCLLLHSNGSVAMELILSDVNRVYAQRNGERMSLSCQAGKAANCSPAPYSLVRCLWITISNGMYLKAAAITAPPFVASGNPTYRDNVTHLTSYVTKVTSTILSKRE